jgi:tRNA pseudouridine38-40 synthase
MRVVRLTVAYDGTDFRGWARQPGLRTVQGVLEQALERILGTAPRLSVAGRTDAGVHARGQVASFIAPGHVDPLRIQRAVNRTLGPEVVVAKAVVAPPGFDARRSATAREYRYRINLAAVPDPFSGRFEWHRPGGLTLSRMRAAASLLVGEHDFASFCRAPKLPASTRRSLERLSVSRRADRVAVTALASGFLHQMVRSLVGTLVAVGEGRLDPTDMPAVLAARDRAAAGPVAPARGLTLESVTYGRPSRKGE